MYPKRGNNDYAQVNPINFCPVFTQEQISASLCATSLYEPVLATTVLMNQEQLYSNILTSLHSDPAYINHQTSPKPHWSLISDGFLRHYDLIYVPDSSNLQLHDLHYKHDHILAGHPGQNKTVELIQ